MLKALASYITYDLPSLERSSRIADALNFFIYETIKIFLLLAVVIFAVSFIRSYFPPERMKRILSHKREFIGNILAAPLGIVTLIQEFMKYAMSTPGLVVNGKLKHSGKPLPSIEKVKALIKEEA